MSQTKPLRKVKPFRNIEEIKRRVTPSSLWQLGCDDAKAGRPRLVSHWEGICDGYSNGYAFGRSIRMDTADLPVFKMTEPGRYNFPCGTTIVINR